MNDEWKKNCGVRGGTGGARGSAGLAGIILALLCFVLAAGAARADAPQQQFSFADRLRASGLHKTAVPEFEKFLKAWPGHELLELARR